MQIASSIDRLLSMPAHGYGTAPQIPLLKRAAIVTLWWHAHMSYRKIGNQLGVSKSTVESIIKRAKVSSMFLNARIAGNWV